MNWEWKLRLRGGIFKGFPASVKCGENVSSGVVRDKHDCTMPDLAFGHTTKPARWDASQ
jgi:hypothetical protein